MGSFIYIFLSRATDRALVMAPQFDLTDMIAKTAAIEELFKTAFIPTDRASQYFRWLDELRLLKHCGRVIGPRDTGKSQQFQIQILTRGKASRRIPGLPTGQHYGADGAEFWCVDRLS